MFISQTTKCCDELKKRLDFEPENLVNGRREWSMVHRRAKLILIASAAWFLLSARPPGCLALPVDMGIAGPSYWTVVQTGGGTITVTPPVSKSGKRKRSNRTVATSAPPIGIMGNVAVAQGGQISDSGDQFEGDL